MPKPQNYSKDINILSPEEVKTKTLYTLTIAPSDGLQFWDCNSIQRIADSITDIETCVIYPLCPNTDIHLTLEVSRTGRIHWHGTIEFTKTEDIRMFYLNHIHRLTDNRYMIEIDTINDADYWDVYCNKSFYLWKTKISSKETLIKRKPKPIQKNFTQYLKNNESDSS